MFAFITYIVTVLSYHFFRTFYGHQLAHPPITITKNFMTKQAVSEIYKNVVSFLNFWLSYFLSFHLFMFDVAQYPFQMASSQELEHKTFTVTNLQHLFPKKEDKKNLFVNKSEVLKASYISALKKKMKLGSSM